MKYEHRCWDSVAQRIVQEMIWREIVFRVSYDGDMVVFQSDDPRLMDYKDQVR